MQYGNFSLLFVVFGDHCDSCLAGILFRLFKIIHGKILRMLDSVLSVQTWLQIVTYSKVQE